MSSMTDQKIISAKSIASGYLWNDGYAIFLSRFSRRKLGVITEFCFSVWLGRKTCVNTEKLVQHRCYN